MGQLTIYLGSDLATRIRKAAKSAGVSQSKWIASLAEEKLADRWPDSVMDLAGAWRDFPSLESIRDHDEGDVPREPL